MLLGKLGGKVESKCDFGNTERPWSEAKVIHGRAENGSNVVDRSRVVLHRFSVRKKDRKNLKRKEGTKREINQTVGSFSIPKIIVKEEEKGGNHIQKPRSNISNSAWTKIARSSKKPKPC